MNLLNTHTRKVVPFTKSSNQERGNIYFNTAYARIYKQGIKGGCEALSYEADNDLYQVFTHCANKRRKYKSVYLELFPEFMLFEKQYTVSGYWFSEGEAGKNERILAFLFCEQIALNTC